MQTPSGTNAPAESIPYSAMPAPPQANNPNSLLAIAWRRKGLLIFFLLCGLGGGHYYYSQLPETFSSASLVEVFRQQAQSTTGSAIEELKDLTPSVAFIDAEMKSDSVLEKAVEIGQLTSFEGMPSDPLAVMNKLRMGLRVDSPLGASAGSVDRTLFQVRYESGDPALCAAVVNSAVKAYEEYVNGRHLRSIEGVVSFFKEAKGSILPQLTELEGQYTEFRGQAPLEWTANGEAVNPFREDAIRLEENLNTLERERRQLETKLKLIEDTTRGQSSAVAVLQEVQYLVDDVSSLNEIQASISETPNADIELKTKLMGLRVQAELLAKQYAPNHPQRESVENELAATEKALREIQAVRDIDSPEVIDVGQRREETAKSILRSYVSGLRKKQQLLADDIEDLTKRLEDVRERAHKITVFENENGSYQRRIARLQGMLDSFDSELEKASLPLLNPGLQVNVFRPAGYGAKVGPELPKNLALGAFAGLAVGGLLGWLLDWSERTFRNPDEVVEALNVEILSHMPLMRLRKRKLKEGDDPRLESIDAAVSVVHEPHSPGSESIRQVRNSLLANAELEYQVIQVTSSMPGDGKSTIASNFAVSMAGANKRVVIVDADLRRPTQHKLLNLDSSKGVTDVLNGDLELRDVIQETGVDGLFAISTGPKPSNPAEALSMPEFGQMLDDLRMQFDLVIVDTPPILAVSDASAVAKNVDGVLFVMRIGRNSKPMAKRSITILKTLHVNIIGLVINAIGDSGYSAAYATAWSNYYGGRPGGEYGYGYRRYGYRYRYGYGYGYGRSYGNDKYREASRGQRVKVRGRLKINGIAQAGAVSVAEEE